MENKKIKFLKERIDTFTNKTDEIQLFLLDDTVDLNELVLFCKEVKQQKLHGAMFHVFVFFDNENYAEFPKNPITAGYTPDGESEVMKHIKAVYMYNQVNQYSKLSLYDKNALESLLEEISI